MFEWLICRIKGHIPKISPPPQEMIDFIHTHGLLKGEMATYNEEVRCKRCGYCIKVGGCFSIGRDAMYPIIFYKLGDKRIV